MTLTTIAALIAELGVLAGAIIPEVITVTFAFAKDECGWWGDVLYCSLIDGNVYTPEHYADGWEKM